MLRVEDIERALAEQFDVEHLSVYADYLQSTGDPRGELIALDLQRVPISPRYDRVMSDWLGRHEHALRERMSFRYGFVAQLTLVEGPRPSDALRLLAASPAAPYLLRLHVEGSHRFLHDTIRELVEQPRPWLQRLVLRQGYSRGESRSAPAIDGPLVRALAEATPSLHAVEVHGDTVLGGFGHPNLRALRVASSTGVRSLINETIGPAFDALTYLDLRVDGAVELRDAARRAGVLRPAQLPCLTRLDLTSTYGAQRFGHPEPLDVLEVLEIRRQLRHARVPRADLTDGARLERLIADMPQLVELAIDELYNPQRRPVPPQIKALHQVVAFDDPLGRPR